MNRLQVSIFWLCLLLGLYTTRLGAQNTEEIDVSLHQVDELLDHARYADSDTEKERLALTAFEMAHKSGYKTGVLKSSLILGRVAVASGQYKKAMGHFLEAESKARQVDTKQLPMIHRALGDLFFQQKLYANARKFYEAVLEAEPDNLQVVELAADAALYELNYDTAEYFYKGLITQFKKEGDNARLVQIYQKLAASYDRHDLPGKALYYYLRIEDLIENHGDTREKGRLYNNLGKLYVTLKDFRKALDYLKKAESLCRFGQGDESSACDYPEIFYTNMGIALHNSGNTPAGLDYLFKAAEVLSKRKDWAALAGVEHIIATVYFSANDLYNALAHNNKAIELAEKTRQPDILARACKTAANLHQELYDFEQAFAYYNRYFTLLDSIRKEDTRQKAVFDQQSNLLRAAEGEIRFLLAQQEIKDRDLQQARTEQDKLEFNNRALAAEARQREQEFALIEKEKEVNAALAREKAAEALRIQQELRLSAQQLDAEKQNALIAELRRKEEIEQAESLSREQEVELLRRQQAITDLELREQRAYERNVTIIMSLGALLLAFFGVAWWYARRAGRRLRIQNQKIEAQRDLIETERGKSDRLLRNILPDEVANELKTRGHAEPRLYDSATVVFTDFVNFTQLSERLSPEQIISELDECFLAFDEIAERYNLEKIKTIGDAFMCAGGIPAPNENHAFDAVYAAIEMLEWLEIRSKSKPTAIFREMRIGIHTGPVVAGVIGKNKFAYDIWGDAVNLAARLEELGGINRVNISKATFDIVKDQFQCHYRGQQPVHNKGMVDMYFVEKKHE